MSCARNYLRVMLRVKADISFAADLQIGVYLSAVKCLNVFTMCSLLTSYSVTR